MEDKVYKALSMEFGIERQVPFQWCKNKRCLPFDFWVEDTSILIELDGEQHFRQVSNWDTPEEVQIRDHLKVSKALENGFSIIRLLWTDVYYDKNDWLDNLVNIIWGLVLKDGEPCVVYMNSGGEYDDYPEY